MKKMDKSFEFPERLWRKPMEFYNGKPRVRIAASSYDKSTSYSPFVDEATPENKQINSAPSAQSDGSDSSGVDLVAEPEVKVYTEAGNARVTVELTTVKKQDLKLNCAEDSLTLSVKTPTGSWTKEVPLPFRVDPDTAKAVFKNGRLELVVRKHGRFNPPGPKVDWV